MPLRTNDRSISGRRSFDFGERLRVDAAEVTKIKISSGTPFTAKFKPATGNRRKREDRCDRVDVHAAIHVAGFRSETRASSPRN